MIKREEYKLRQLFDRLDGITKDIETLNHTYERLKEEMKNSKNAAELFEKNIYSHYILDEIDRKKEEKVNLLKDIDSLKKRLSRLHGEKKAVERFIMKLERERKREELIQEGRLADEVFSRRFSDSSYNG
ncbi:hypothetical protein [Desulfurobacterium sp.]